MIIINSAAYVIPEFRAEFGQIPPCLLPIGNRKLVEYQVPMLRKACDEKIVISLPEGYELTIDEHQLFSVLGIEVAYVPPRFTLAEALLFVLNTVGERFEHGEPLRLLHGDTLLAKVPDGADLIAVASTDDDYNWEAETSRTGRPLVWCGYFAFSSPRAFIRTLALSRENFVKAVRLYAENIPLAVAESEDWHDLGHVNTYFVSRSQITTQRVFNSLRIENGTVWKSGIQARKIEAESEWFKRLPVPLKRYTPQLIDSGCDPESGVPYYILEYLPCSPLNEVFVHGRNPDFFWRRVFKLLGDFLQQARHCVSAVSEARCDKAIEADAYDLYESKTYRRLEEYASKKSIDLTTCVSYANKELGSLFDIARDCITRTVVLPVVPAVLHGDFCFSNILLDSRAGSIKVIDPRGLNQKNELTSLGDQKYDLAKVCHSVIGLYDFIIAGRYQLEPSHNGGSAIVHFHVDDRLLNIQQAFLECELLPGISARKIIPLTVLLFLSMLPLHADRPDRQQAMLANALRLYTDYVI